MQWDDPSEISLQPLTRRVGCQFSGSESLCCLPENPSIDCRQPMYPVSDSFTSGHMPENICAVRSRLNQFRSRVWILRHGNRVYCRIIYGFIYPCPGNRGPENRRVSLREQREKSIKNKCVILGAFLDDAAKNKKIKKIKKIFKKK